MSLRRGNHEERPSWLSLNCGRQGDPFSVSGSLVFVQLAAAWLRVDVLLLLVSALPPRLRPIPGQIRADLSDVQVHASSSLVDISEGNYECENCV